MTDMQRSGRIGGDVFDIRLDAFANIGVTIGFAFVDNRRQNFWPEGFLEFHVDEAGTCNSD